MKNSLERIKNLKTLSIATLILVPLIPNTILLIEFTGRSLRTPGLEFVFILSIGLSIFFAFFAVLQLQVKQKLEEKNGSLSKMSPYLSIILALIISIAYVGIQVDENIPIYGFYNVLYNVLFSRYAIFFLFFPLISIFIAIQSNREKKRQYPQFLCWICYAGYAIFPLFLVINEFVR